MKFLSISLKFGYEETRIKIVNVMYLSFETTQRFGKKSAFNVIMCCITHPPLLRRKNQSME